jgi:hypothetical protein
MMFAHSIRRTFLRNFTLRLLGVLGFCFSAVPAFLLLTKMQAFFSLLQAHGMTNNMHVITAFIILIMAATGIFLSLGLALLSMGEDWYLKRQHLKEGAHLPGGEGLNALTDILDTLGDSIMRLEARSQTLQAQMKNISRLSQNAGVRAVTAPSS